MPADLRVPAEAALGCLGVGPSDAVLIVHNDEQRAIAAALAAAAEPRARSVTLLAFPAASRHGEEPPANVAEAMVRADAVLAPTSWSLSHTQARIAASRRGARVATMPTITSETFARAVAIDYPHLKRRGDRLAARLSSARTARLTSPAGTDIVLAIEGRTGRNDDGHLRRPGSFGNLPAGEAYVAPRETFGDGIIVFDGSLAGYGRLSTPVRVAVERGRAVDADTDAGAWLLATLDAGGPYGRCIAELGIGTNPAARLTGDVLEDEKAIGTIHVAFGASAGIGGAHAADVHIDGIMLRPTVELDAEPVLDDGHLLIP